ncbi:MAG: endonuclease/exonuclease/phosphatase family protein [Betaproteobacteria bacterium]
MPSTLTRRLRGVAPPLAALALCACVTLTESPRGVSPSGDGTLRVSAIGCSAAIGERRRPGERAGGASPDDTGRVPDVASASGLDPDSLRLLTWNLHKQGDVGWDRDLARFLRDADVALLQEAVLRDDLRALLDARGLRYTMASSFIYRDVDHGVVTAATVPPLATCAERAVEPLLRIPKSGLIAWYALKGRVETLAVVNVHAINFSLAQRAYEAQFAALVRPLAAHRGPIVFAGDFNTWSEGRRAAVRAAALTLGLTEISFEPDLRARFLGQQVDHVMVRGVALLAAAAFEVKSSDHNPVLVTLRVDAAH